MTGPEYEHQAEDNKQYLNEGQNIFDQSGFGDIAAFSAEDQVPISAVRRALWLTATKIAFSSDSSQEPYQALVGLLRQPEPERQSFLAAQIGGIFLGRRGELHRPAPEEAVPIPREEADRRKGATLRFLVGKYSLEPEKLYYIKFMVTTGAYNVYGGSNVISRTLTYDAWLSLNRRLETIKNNEVVGGPEGLATKPTVRPGVRGIRSDIDKKASSEIKPKKQQN